MESAGAPYLLRLRGRYVKGLGRSGLFLGMKIYREIFRERLRADPYPGTLNIEIEGFRSYDELRKICPEHEAIGDFEFEGRTYGGLYMWRAVFRGSEVLLIRPYRSSHDPRILEIVSGERLVDRYGIREGDIITLDIKCYERR